jgi:hypothetical protein
MFYLKSSAKRLEYTKLYAPLVLYGGATWSLTLREEHGHDPEDGRMCHEHFGLCDYRVRYMRYFVLNLT